MTPEPAWASRRARRLTKALVVAIIVAVPASALAADRAARGGLPSPVASGAPDPKPGHLDVRERASAKVPSSSLRAGQRRLRRRLGRRATFRLDRVTGTPAIVAPERGYLAGSSGRGPAATALGYVRRHSAAFGLDADDLHRLELRRDVRVGPGARRLRFIQTDRGIPSLDTGLDATLAPGGRLLSVGGGPRPDLHVRSTAPRLSASGAVASLARNVHAAARPRAVSGSRGPRRTTRFAGGSSAQLVIFPEPGRTRLAWHVLLFDDPGHAWLAVVDADTGAVLKRDNLTHSIDGLAFDYYPGAANGGDQRPVDLSPWLSGDDPTTLAGNNAHVYSDDDDGTYVVQNDGTAPQDREPAPGDEIPRKNDTDDWSYPQDHRPWDPDFPDETCPTAGCSWNGWDYQDPPFSFPWQVNREQAGTNLFYLVNNFHDWLRDADGIDFTETQGNFEGDGPGGDRLVAQVDDGADTDPDFPGVPACNRLNNANMTTLPDDHSPKMQMYLFSSVCGDDGVNDVNGADDAAIVYHEYTHGLSGRLVVGADGYEELGGPQSGAMGEAWSDWYAMDYLNAHGFQPDTATPGDVALGAYENLRLREQGLDCPVGAPSSGCPLGGLTYGDFGHVVGGAEVHADGEIWAETLWDLRRRLRSAHADGLSRARALVTDAMSLAPTPPDFLDMRDAILEADKVRGFGDRCRIWEVFAARGMGSNASSPGGDSATGITQGFANPCVPAATAQSGGSSTPAAAGTPAASATPEPPAKPNLKHAKRRARVDRHRRFRYAFRATPGLRGRAGFVTRKKVRVSARHRRRVTFARASFRVAKGGKVTLRVRLSRRAYRILRHYRKLVLTVTVTVRNGAGLKAKSTRRLTLLAPRRHRR
jgi:extracellular elastinolytic metalloproteinase